MKKLLMAIMIIVSSLFGSPLHDNLLVEQTYQNINITGDEDIATGFIFNWCGEPITVDIKVYPEQCKNNIVHNQIYSGKLKNVVLKSYPSYILLYKPDDNCKMISKIIVKSQDETIILKFDDVFLPEGYLDK